MTHMLYFVDNKDQRVKLLQALFDKVVRYGGVFILEHNSCTRMKNFIDKVAGPGNELLFQKAAVHRREVLRTGFCVLDSFTYQLPMVFKNMSKDFVDFYSYLVRRKATPEELEAAGDIYFPPGLQYTTHKTTLFLKPPPALL